MAAVPAWIWYALGWLLIAAGAWPLLTGGLKRRHRGRRCRRCTYDMKGLDSRTCPECGREAKSERELTCRRRKWRWRTAGLVAMLLGWCSLQAPSVIAHGWAATLPSTLLARIAPLERSDGTPGASTRMQSGIRVTSGMFVRKPRTPPAAQPTPAASTLGDRAADTLFDEIWRRINRDEISEEAATAYLRRIASLTGAKGFVVPEVWAVDAAPPVLASFDSSAGVSVSGTVTKAKTPGDSMQVTAEIAVNSRRYTVFNADLPIKVHATTAAMMEPVRGPEIDALVAAATAPRLIVRGESAWIELNDRRAAPEWHPIPPYVYARVRLLLDGKEIGHTSFGLSSPAAGSISTRIAALISWEPGGDKAALASPDDVAFELTGDLPTAAEMYMINWNDKPEAWSGRVVVTPKK